MSGNSDLFGIEETAPEKSEETKVEDDNWIDEEPENLEEDISGFEVEKERLDSSEMRRNEKIAYIDDVYGKLVEFFQSDDIKDFRWRVRRRGQFQLKIKKVSSTIGIIKTKTIFNFYDRKLENMIKESKELKGLFDFR